jgi:hypothetical protein
MTKAEFRTYLPKLIPLQAFHCVHAGEYEVEKGITVVTEQDDTVIVKTAFGYETRRGSLLRFQYDPAEPNHHYQAMPRTS